VTTAANSEAAAARATKLVRNPLLEGKHPQHLDARAVLVNSEDLSILIEEASGTMREFAKRQVPVAFVANPAKQKGYHASLHEPEQIVMP
jgi:hypothetical protein